MSLSNKLSQFISIINNEQALKAEDIYCIFLHEICFTLHLRLFLGYVKKKIKNW